MNVVGPAMFSLSGDPMQAINFAVSHEETGGLDP